MRKRFVKMAMIFLTLSLLAMVSCSVIETTEDKKLDSNDAYSDEVKNDNMDSEPDDSVYSISETEDPNLPDPEESTPLPWENGGKQPKDYTWEEFEALTGGHQIAFQNSFENIDAFDAWLQEAQYGTSDNPWENGGKQPNDYTWKEFEALNPGQQIAFQNTFENIDAFDAWLQKAQYDDLDNPWENGGKQPKDYTWEEFEALTPGQQIAFQNSFENIDEFDKWLNANCPQ